VVDITVTSWSDLNHQLFEGSWHEPLKRFRSNYVYRGLSHSSYELKTSLIRLGGAYERLENHILRNFRKYAHRDAVSGDSIWNWLAVAQHHGLPTRLLDWTFSPYVAAHFATANLEHLGVEGVIWCVDYVEAHKYLPASLREILEQEGANGFTVEMLSRAADKLPEFDKLSFLSRRLLMIASSTSMPFFRPSPIQFPCWTGGWPIIPACVEE